MKISNQELKTLYQWMDVPLHGEEMRARSAFMRMTIDKHKAIEDTRVKMLQDMADKDEEGKPIIEGGTYKLSPEAVKKFSEEFRVVLDAENEFEVTPEVKKHMKNILENKLNRGFRIDEATIHTTLVEKFT